MKLVMVFVVVLASLLFTTEAMYIDECDLCFNGGQCRYLDGVDQYCVCPVGYTGNRCELTDILYLDSLQIDH